MNVYALTDAVVACTNTMPSGFGPQVWAGELRTADTLQPIPALDRGRRVYPAVVGLTEPAVLEVLVGRAEHLIITTKENHAHRNA